MRREKKGVGQETGVASEGLSSSGTVGPAVPDGQCRPLEGDARSAPGVPHLYRKFSRVLKTWSWVLMVWALAFSALSMAFSVLANLGRLARGL